MGVTGKTISRWETGSYLPPVEMLQLLGEEFHLSINELLTGQILTADAFRKTADENLLALAKESAFSLSEKKEFLIRKWRKEHIALFVILGMIALAAWIIPLCIHKTCYFCFSALISAFEYGWQNNQMMIYVENHLYEK